MNEGSLGRRYAKALLVVAQKNQCVDLVSHQLEAIYSQFDEKGPFVQFISNPSLSNKDKESVINTVLQKWNLHQSVNHLIKLMFDRKRLIYFQSVIREFQAMADENLNQIRVLVGLPFSNEKQVEDIKIKLATMIKKKIILNSTIDQSLLGGILIKIKDNLYDGSLKAQLALLGSQAEGRVFN